MTRARVDPEKLRGELVQLLGEKRVSLEAADLDTYARDMWPRLLIARRAGAAPEHLPHAVAWPESAEEVAAIVQLARRMGIAVIPYGGGSGVCGGVVPLHGGITLDLKRMNKLTAVRRDELLCDVEAGLNGERFERELERRGYTFGNFPSSIYCSTVGGWLATRAAGQMSTKYGKVEDRVAGLTVVTGRGEIIRTDGLARATRGPGWNQLLLGSEGTLAVITSARLRLSPAPRLRVLRGFEVESVAHGVEAIRRVMQRGLKPAVVRLYDEFDTFIHSFGDSEEELRGNHHRRGPTPELGEGALPDFPTGDDQSDDTAPSVMSRVAGLLGRTRRRGLRRTLQTEAMQAALSHPKLLNSLAGTLVEKVARKGCLLIIGVEGAQIRTEVEARLVMNELERAGAVDLGEAPGRKWFENRYSVSYKMSPMFRDGAFVDTMEVASTWERLLDMYESVRSAISRYAVVMAHFSHAYSEGCSIYFSFAGHADSRREAEKLYDAIWRDGLAATSRVGGTISHHHGVGMLKSAHMGAEHRESMSILHALKRTFDPDSIMNPGKLGMPYSEPGR